MKLLLVEDEKDLANSVCAYLADSGYLCETSATFDSANEKINLYTYDCVLVDITLPGGNGLDLIRTLKKNKSNTGVIIISAKNSTDDKIMGLDIGADDYISKPFSLAELNSRIRSVLRRRNFDGTDEITFNEISVLVSHNVVKVNNEVVALTRKEYDLALFFLSNKNRVVTKETIAAHLWGDDVDSLDSYDFIYTHIKNLRKKLMDKGSKDYIKTIYGAGYRFSE